MVEEENDESSHIMTIHSDETAAEAQGGIVAIAMEMAATTTVQETRTADEIAAEIVIGTVEETEVAIGSGETIGMIGGGETEHLNKSGTYAISSSV